MTRADPDGPAVIVDPYSSGAFYAPAFAAAGVPTVAVRSGRAVAEVHRGGYRPEDFTAVIVNDGDVGAVVDQLRRLAPRCVLPGTETGVELADRLAAAVTEDVANVPAGAAARCDKGEMGAAVAAAGLAVIRQICTADPAEVTAWLRREGLTGRDLVLKPPVGASSAGVTRVPAGGDWRAVFDAQLGRPNHWQVVNDRMLVQEHVTGTEYVVDTFSYGGVHTVTDVCRYTKVDNGRYMAVYDSMEWLHPQDPVLPDLIEYAFRVLDAVGVRFGAAHVELMLTPAGVRMIELNARPHGGGQPRFCRVATGGSQIDRAVRFFARQGEIPRGYQLHRTVLVVFLIGRADGVVRNAEVLGDVRALPTFHWCSIGVRTGDRIAVTRDLLGSLGLGFVVLAGADRDQVLADYQRVRRIEARLRVDAVDQAGVR